MALNRYVLTATVTVTPGAPAVLVAGEPATGGAFGTGATTGGPLMPSTLIKGTPIILDPASAMYAAIGAGNLRAYVPGQDDVGHAALGN